MKMMFSEEESSGSDGESEIIKQLKGQVPSVNNEQ